MWNAQNPQLILQLWVGKNLVLTKKEHEKLVFFVYWFCLFVGSCLHMFRAVYLLVLSQMQKGKENNKKKN